MDFLYSLYDALVSINACRLTRLGRSWMQWSCDMGTILATKQDLAATRLLAVKQESQF